MGHADVDTMTSLYLIRVPIATDELAKWAGERGWLRGRRDIVAYDEGRALHHLLDETFGPGTFRPFRLFVPPRRTVGNLYAYCALAAKELQEAARVYALPDHLRVLSLDRLEGKQMPADWRVGQQLGFDLRVRPVRRLREDLVTPRGQFRKRAEVDAFLLEALRSHSSTRKGMADTNRAREAVYLDWLAERLAPAAELDRSVCRLARFLRTRTAREGLGSEGPDATLHGALTVTDPGAFHQVLLRGLGRHRAYGYGMLLLRPPSGAVPDR